jgi:hypothetical protein
MKHPLLSLVGFGAAAMAALACSAALAHGGDGPSPRDTQALLVELRHATQPFRDVNAATDAGYTQFQDCVSQPGHGAMGIHFLNNALAGDAEIDPLKPEALMYEPGPDGKLDLLGVEYIVFQAAWDAAHPQPPVLFGHPFHLVREPNRYGVPPFYELHVWLWRHNPGNLHDDWNPRVSCP